MTRLIAIGLLLVGSTVHAAQFTPTGRPGRQITIATFARTNCPAGFVVLFSGTQYFLEKTGTNAFSVDERCLESPPTLPGGWTAAPTNACVVCKAVR